jgi:uncharacterized protein (DUF1778 family)
MQADRVVAVFAKSGGPKEHFRTGRSSVSSVDNRKHSAYCCTYSVITPSVKSMSATARSTSRPTQPKSQRLAVRITPEQRSLLSEASRAQETTITEFVLGAATRAAEDVLADRRRFVLAESDWAAFVAALDQPPRDLPRLRRLLTTPSVLDEA